MAETSRASQHPPGFARWLWRVTLTGTLAFVLLRMFLLVAGTGSMLGTFDAALVLLVIVVLLSTAVCMPQLVLRAVPGIPSARSSILGDALRVTAVVSVMWFLARSLVT